MYLRYTFNLASTKEDEEMAAGAFEGAVMLTMMDAKENSIPPMDLPIPRQCSKGKQKAHLFWEIKVLFTYT